jgi:hypothetical protein
VKVVIGFGYDDSQLKERRHPTRDELDAITRDHPLMVVHQSGHIATMNSRGLEFVGYGAGTANPAGGVIRRREGSREPDSVLEETAFFNAAGKLLPSLGPIGLRLFAREGARLWARFGYTTGQEGRATPDTAEVLREVADQDGLPIDAAVYADVLVDTAAMRP